MRWLVKVIKYGLSILVIAFLAVLGAYYAGIRLPVHADAASFALQNWNKTAPVAVDADYASSLVRRNGRIHVTVDLALPEPARRLQDYMDGGRTLVVACGRQQLYVHHLGDAALDIRNPRIGISGTIEIELTGALSLHEGRRVAVEIETGHDRTSVWADVTSIKIDGLPDPMVEPMLRKLARKTFSREQILDLATGSLSPELAGVLARHRDALDLAFEDIVASDSGGALALQAVFSIDEGAAFGVARDRLVENSTTALSQVASLFAPARAQAQGLGRIGDLLDQMGGGDAREILEDSMRDGGLESLAGRLAGLAKCRTMF